MGDTARDIDEAGGTLALLRETARACDVRNHAEVASWLREVHARMKRLARPWSYVLFTELAGLGRSNWLAQVVVHKRRLTEASARRIAERLELPSTHADSLAALVRHGLARDPLRRQELWKDVEKSQAKRNKALRGDSLFAFLDEWHHVVVLETLALFPRGAAPGSIAAALRDPVAPDALARSLDLLASMGLVACGEDGLWTKTTGDLDLGGSIPGSGVLRFHHRMIDLAKDAVTHLPETEREVAAMTLACPRAALPKLKRVLEEFQRYVLWMAQQEGEPDAVFQLNLQLFPLTRDRRRP